MRRIAGEFWVQNKEEDQILGYKKNNDECVEAHLLAYPEIFDPFQKYRNIKSKLELERKWFFDKLQEKTKKVFLEKVTGGNPDLGSVKYVMTILPSSIYEIVASKRSFDIKVDGGKLSIENVLMTKHGRWSEKIQDFLIRETKDENNISTINRIEKMEQDANNRQKVFQKKTRELIMKINSGEPLKPKCNTCPEVYDLPKK